MSIKIFSPVLKHKRAAAAILLAGILAVGGTLTIRARISVSKSTVSEELAYARTVFLKKEDLNESVNVSGIVQSAQVSSVTTALNNKVTSLNVKVGDHVNKGDVICTLDDTDIRRAIQDKEKEMGEEKQRLQDSCLLYTSMGAGIVHNAVQGILLQVNVTLLVVTGLTIAIFAHQQLGNIEELVAVLLAHFHQGQIEFVDGFLAHVGIIAVVLRDGRYRCHNHIAIGVCGDDGVQCRLVTAGEAVCTHAAVSYTHLPAPFSPTMPIRSPFSTVALMS